MTCPACGYHLDEADAAFCGNCGASTRARRSSLIGTILDERYRVDAKLAEGGFGSIYRATHVASGLDVALKVLHADLASDRSLATRFRREAACLERLHDPHTVACYEVGEAADGTLYIAMELLVGESLHDRMLAKGRLGWRTALSIVRDACSSLAEAHELGIIHRDLKPANLHLGANDIVKVLDFGIARIANSEVDDGAELTRMGQMIGTLEYMAPEQVIGGACDSRSDIYQLGILAYEMITGRRPFAGTSNPTSLITALLTQSPPAPSTMFCGGCLPQEVDRLILRCLEREPEHRFASVHRLVDAIDAALLLSDAQPSHRNLDADDEAPTWIAGSHSTAAAMAPARTTVGPRVEPAAMPAFEVPIRGSHMATPPLANAPIATPTPDRGLPVAMMPDVITPDLTRPKEFTSSERRLAQGTSSPAIADAQFALGSSSPPRSSSTPRSLPPSDPPAPLRRSPSNPPPMPARASSPSMQPSRRASSPVLPASVVPIRPSAMPLRSPDVSLPGLPPQRASSPTGFEPEQAPTGFERTQQLDTPPDLLAFAPAGSQTNVPSGPQTDPVIQLLYPHGKREIPLDLDNTPDRKPGLSFGARVALWTAGLAVGGTAIGAFIANLVG